MDYLESNFYIGIQDGLDGTLPEDVISKSFMDIKEVQQALDEYRAGVILGSIMLQSGEGSDYFIKNEIEIKELTKCSESLY